MLLAAQKKIVLFRVDTSFPGVPVISARFGWRRKLLYVWRLFEGVAGEDNHSVRQRWRVLARAPVWSMIVTNAFDSEVRDVTLQGATCGRGA